MFEKSLLASLKANEKPDETDVWQLGPSLLNFKTTNDAMKLTYTKMLF